MIATAGQNGGISDLVQRPVEPADT